MQEGSYLKGVREQYEALPFPRVDPQDEVRRLQVTPQDTLANINHYCFGGQRDFRRGFRALIAGGGTGHATIHLAEQLRETDAEVVYLDLSAASMAIAKQRASLRGLRNIRFMQESLLRLPELGLGSFDYINCTGVLHHLEDPQQGLAALVQVLAPGGALGLMVYAPYGRACHYHVQALMGLLEQPQDTIPDRVAHARAVLTTLPPSFFAGHGLDPKRVVQGFLDDEADLYDTFLHRQDRAYSVPQLYDWLGGAGLTLNAFTNFNFNLVERLRYRPELFVRGGPLLDRIMEFPEPRRQAIAEMLCGTIALHTFYASDRTETVADPNDENQVPCFGELVAQGVDVFQPWTAERLAAALEQTAGSPLSVPLGKLTLRLSPGPSTAALLRRIDGSRHLGEIYDEVLAQDASLDRGALQRDFMEIYETFNQVGWLLLRHREVAPYRTYAQMQGPVTAAHRAA